MQKDRSIEARAEYLPTIHDPRPYLRNSRQTTLYEPCGECNSGKKYKWCCKDKKVKEAKEMGPARDEA